jgi:asparagine synthase (glutamine-hydrolysing)
MCGICGKYNPGGVRREEIELMARSITHRGPDDQGYFVDNCIGLGNRRLSIIDLTGGHQPIGNEDGSIQVVFNGEIYNYPALRHELQLAGHDFQTNSDTEVIVHLYEEMGERCVEKLRGMFAFAIWDGTHKKLMLARDHIGQKPLYYAEEGDTFLFGSEAKSILAISQIQPEIDFESVHHYLSLRFIPPPSTMIRHIKKLPPAHILVLQDGVMAISEYWDISFLAKLDLTESEFIEGLRDKLKQTVGLHLISDVPVGAFLSGGMDSSTIVAMMVQELDQPFRTFAVGVTEPDFDELPYARIVADYYRTIHFETLVQSDLIQSLPEMIWHLDEPSDPIAACQYQAADLAAQHVKVVLGGDGGDELFAGFDRYIGVRYVNYYARIPGFIRRQIFGSLLERLPESFAYKSASQKFRWLHQLSMLPTLAERYAEATCFFRFNHDQKQLLYGNWFWNQVEHLHSSDIIVEKFNMAPANDPIDRMLYADYKTRLPEHSLMLTDRMTMAHSLELRSPFLDHELVSYMAAFPSNLKIKDGELKYVLRKLGTDYLPQEILERGKQGFMFPVAYWFRNELYSFLEEYLLNSFFIQAGIFQRESVLQLLQEHRQNKVDHHVRLWMLLNLAIWHELYINQKDVSAVQADMARYLRTPKGAIV